MAYVREQATGRRPLKAFCTWYRTVPACQNGEHDWKRIGSLEFDESWEPPVARKCECNGMCCGIYRCSKCGIEKLELPLDKDYWTYVPNKTAEGGD